MTRTGPRKTVGRDHWNGRLQQARSYLEAAQQAAMFAEPGQNGNPIVSHVVHAAIAFADALTAKRAGVVNKQDHAAAPTLLRDVLRDNLPRKQESRFRQILSEKDAAEYGATSGRLDHAKKLLTELEEFARWAEGQIDQL